MAEHPQFALSIMQPWAWLIANGHKDIENRSWPTRFRGRVLIHAGKTVDDGARRSLLHGQHPVTEEPFDIFAGALIQTGGIVGECEIVDCVTASKSDWFVGRYGFVIRNARPLPFRPLRGQLGFFRVEP